MLLINPETGDIVDANSAACRFYGYGCTDIMKMKISQINTLRHVKNTSEFGPLLKDLAQKNVEFCACANAMRHFGIQSNELLDSL